MVVHFLKSPERKERGFPTRGVSAEVGTTAFAVRSLQFVHPQAPAGRKPALLSDGGHAGVDTKSQMRPRVRKYKQTTAESGSHLLDNPPQVSEFRGGALPMCTDEAPGFVASF